MEWRKRRSVWLCMAVASCLWSAQARANGGGYRFGVKFTGSVAPFQATGTEDVRIEDEQLDITLRRTSAAVVVRYVMRNQNPTPVHVRFGFPVEATRLSDFSCEEEQERGELAKCLRDDLRKSIQFLRGYSVTADGAPVKAVFKIEPFASGKAKPFKGSEVLKGIAGWMVSELTFPAEKPLTLEIHYSADLLTLDNFVSDDNWLSATFVYRLSTGAVWSGPIEKGAITVRADGIAADDVEVLRGKLAREGDRWVREFSNLEPSLEDDIEIRPMPSYFVPGEAQDVQAVGYEHFLQRGEAWGGAHQRFAVSASSTLASAKGHGFGPRHLADADETSPSNPWCEGAKGNGVGEWVELTPTKPARLLGLSICPGYQQPGYYEWNGRPSRVDILLNNEHHFVATLGESEPRTADYGLRGGQFIPIHGYDKPVKKLRITILEVSSGSKWEDTCIQRVELYDLLDKEPPIRGAR